MDTNEIKVGTKVMYSGFPGTVTGVCEWDSSQVEIRLARGTICVGKSTFSGQYENCYIVTEARQ